MMLTIGANVAEKKTGPFMKAEVQCQARDAKLKPLIKVS